MKEEKMDEDTTEIQDAGVEENFDTSNVEIKTEKISPSKESSEKEIKERSKVAVKDSGRSTSTSNQHPPTNYRVKVSGLPRFYSFGDPLLHEFKKMLREELKLNFYYIRSPKKGNSWLYITFTNQADQERALNTLKRYTWKNRTLICTLVIADVLKRKTEDGNDTVETKKPKLDIPIEEQMLMSTIPYHSVSYEEQLSKKNEEAQCLLKWLNELIERRTSQLSGWIDEQIAKNGTSLPFVLDEVRASPVIDGYRNKCEFRVGINPQTQAVTVGYRVDNQEDGSIGVAPPDSLRHLPKKMIQVVKAFERFVIESGYAPHGADGDKGLWRLLLVRMNKAEQVMLVVMVHPPENDPPNLDEIKSSIVKYFTEGDGKGLDVVSIYLHTDKEKSGGIGGDKERRPAGGVEHLWGAPYLEESILGLQLEVTPSFYFQCNAYGAEQLYKAVMELAGVDADTTVLDLCCGSGGMGMILAKHCKEVLGVELMDANVEDAKRLATKNELENCEFMQGKIDDVFPKLAEKVKGKKVVPILDPPRVGISQRMIINLRKLQEAQRLIYVCSNHKLPLKNLLDLATVEPGPFDGTNPFVPTRVIPIDMSPHTLRCELVILCERLDMTKIPKPTRQSPKKDPKKIQKRKRGRKAMLRGGKRSYGGKMFPSRSGFPLPRPRVEPFPVSTRDSLYPPPLRGALYQQNSRSSAFSSNYRDFPNRDAPLFQQNSGVLNSNYGNYDDHQMSSFPPRSSRGTGLLNQFSRNYFDEDDYRSPWKNYNNNPSDRGNVNNIPSLFDLPRRPPQNFDSDISRYSDFRRDVEDAIDSYAQFHRNNPVSKYSSLASAMLEREERAYQAGLTRGLVSAAATMNAVASRQQIRSGKKVRGTPPRGGRR